MLDKFPIPILRELFTRITDYESIINLKLINKRFFKFINDDIVIQRHYLKLKYNLTIDDENLFKYIKLLDSKCYSKFIKHRIFNEEENYLLVNPIKDTFIIWNFISIQDFMCKFVITCSENVCDQLIDLVKGSPNQAINKILSDQGYITLNLNIIDFIDLSDSSDFMKNEVMIKCVFFQEHDSEKPGLKAFVKVYGESFNQNIISVIK